MSKREQRMAASRRALRDVVCMLAGELKGPIDRVCIAVTNYPPDRGTRVVFEAYVLPGHEEIVVPFRKFLSLRTRLTPNSELRSAAKLATKAHEDFMSHSARYCK